MAGDRADRHLPHDLIDGARDLGLLGLSIPQEYGGLGLSVVQKTLVHEMLGRGPWGLASFISVHTGIGCVGIVRFGSAAAEAALPAEDGDRRVDRLVRAHRAAVGLRRRRRCRRAPSASGDSYILNGHKTFITNAPRAHHFVIFARTDSGISAFIVDADRPGVQIGQVFDTIGHHGSQISEIVLEDAAFPPRR